MVAKRPASIRFWEKVDKSGDCWTWTARTDAYGYGAIKVDGKSTLAHRYSWLINVGYLPDDKLVCHHCDNPPCVNPKHLFLGTHKDNYDDMRSKGREKKASPAGEINPMSRLTDGDVRVIRSLVEQGLTQIMVSKFLAVPATTVHNVCSRKTWKHVQ